MPDGKPVNSRENEKVIYEKSGRLAIETMTKY